MSSSRRFWQVGDGERTTLEDAKSRLRMYGLDGRLLGDIALPGIGAVFGISGRSDTGEIFYSYTSFLVPSTVYHFEFETGQSTAFQPPASPSTLRRTDPPGLRHLRDGTRVPMFITARKGLTLDGSHPTVLYAYGGFAARASIVR